MTRLPIRALVVCAVGVLLLTGGPGRESPPAAQAQGAPTTGRIVFAFGPGGVLTEDGTPWQYNMEKGVWITVDEAFAEQGQQTHVQPLPVSVDEIARMESFGFIVTRTGNCWLYDIEKDHWKEIGQPPERR
jgi:hypothetical protein